MSGRQATCREQPAKSLQVRSCAFFTELRRYEVCCANCGRRTRAHFDDDVIPRYACGPRGAAVATLLTACTT